MADEPMADEPAMTRPAQSAHSDEALASHQQQPLREAAQQLVFALSHELGNLMAGVRLQAFLLTDDPSPRALAAASLELDDLSAKAGSLLSQLRPLLSPPAPAAGNPTAVLRQLQAGLDDHLGQGVALRIAGTQRDKDEKALPAIAVDVGLVHCLVLPLLLYAAEAASPGGEVQVGAEASDDGGAVVFSVEDDGDREESLEGWRDQAPRGRPLACQVAHCVLASYGGRLRVGVAGGRTRVELRVPCAKTLG
jgi:signal transduction histidine kinase